MAGGISLSIASDTREFMSGIRSGMIAPLQDAMEILDKLANGGQGTDELTADFERLRTAISAAQGEAKNLNAAINSAGGGKGGQTAMVFEDLGKSGEEAGEKIEGGSKLGEAALMNLGFSASSAGEAFDGVGGLSESVGSFAAFLGPAILEMDELGAAAGPIALAVTVIGTALAAVGGLITNAGQASSEAAQKVQEHIDSLVSSWTDQNKATTSGAKALQEWAANSSDVGISLKDLQADLKGTASNYGAVAEAIAEKSVPKMQAQKKAIDEQIDSLDKQADSLNAAGNGSSALANKYTTQADRLEKVDAALKSNISANSEAAAVERSLAAAQGETVKQYEAQQRGAAQAKSATSSFNEAIKDSAKSMSENASSAINDSKLSAAAYIKNQQSQIDALDRFEQNASAVYKTVDANTRDYLKSQGTSMSQEYATYLAATPAQQAQLRKDWAIEAAISGDTSDVDAKAAAEGKKTTKGPTAKLSGDTSDVDKKTSAKSRESAKGPTSKLQGDTSDVDRKVKQKSGEKASGPTVKLRPDDSAVSRALAEYGRKSVTIPVRFSADTSSADVAISRLRNTSITIPVRTQAVDK